MSSSPSSSPAPSSPSSSSSNGANKRRAGEHMARESTGPLEYVDEHGNVYDNEGCLVDDRNVQPRSVFDASGGTSPPHAGPDGAETDKTSSNAGQPEVETEPSAPIPPCIQALLRGEGEVTPEQMWELIKAFFNHPDRTKACIMPFDEFQYWLVWTLSTEFVDDGKGGKTEQFCLLRSAGYEWMKVIFPPMVASYSKLTYEGNIHEKNPKLMPKNTAGIKQSVDVSLRKWNPANVAPDGIHDALAIKVRKFYKDMADWFVEQLFELEKRSKLAKEWCDKARQKVAEREQGGAEQPDVAPVFKAPTKTARGVVAKAAKITAEEQAAKDAAEAEALAKAKKEFGLNLVHNVFKMSPTHNWWRTNFGTRLLRKPTAKQEEYLKEHPYRPPTTDLAKVWNKQHLMLVNLNVWTVKSPEELKAPDGWARGLNFLKKVPRTDLGVNDGDIICPVVTFTALEAGSDKAGIMSYLDGHVHVRCPTHLSSQLHDNGLPSDEVALIASAPIPKFPAEMMYNPEHQRAYLKLGPAEETSAQFLKLMAAPVVRKGEQLALPPADQVPYIEEA